VAPWSSFRHATTPVLLVAVDGDSMRPALTPGDRVLVVRAAARVGDIVAVRDPRRPDRTMLKRVASIDGDRIVVLGDNAGASTDSRTFGPVDRASIVGRAVYRYAPVSRAGRLRRAPVTGPS
jgi:nickel-type superoxide dismutase maturation protease